MTSSVNTNFDPSIGEQICKLAAEGKLLKTIVNEVSIPYYRLAQWRRNNPLFDQALSHAQEQGVHALVDESIEIADNKAIDPKRARNMIGARQWAAERRLRKEYGQSLDVNLTERVDLGGTLLEARRRTVLPGSNLQQITDVQVIDMKPLATVRTTDTQSVTTRPVVNPFD